VYQYRVAVPISFSDEMESVLAGKASVSLEAVLPAHADIPPTQSTPSQPSSAMAVLLIYGNDLDSVATLKSWLASRRGEHGIDLRGEAPRGRFTFSFHDHTLEEIIDWATQSSANPSVAE
jgi:hypothetical protein